MISGPAWSVSTTVFELHSLDVVSDVFPQPFEGAKVVINKGLSSHFQVSHNITMSQLQPSGYRFGATYVGTKQFSPTEVSKSGERNQL